MCPKYKRCEICVEDTSDYNNLPMILLILYYLERTYPLNGHISFIHIDRKIFSQKLKRQENDNVRIF